MIEQRLKKPRSAIKDNIHKRPLERFFNGRLSVYSVEFEEIHLLSFSNVHDS